jgi:hypothetical protein
MEPTFTQKLRFFVSGGSSAAPLGAELSIQTENKPRSISKEA